MTLNSSRAVFYRLVLLFALSGLQVSPCQGVFWRADWPTGDPAWRTTKEGYMKNAARIVNNQLGALGSGTLIQDNWVVTAKHVIAQNGTLSNPKQVTVTLGPYGGNFQVANIYAPNNGGDIALLKLKQTPPNALQVPLNDLGNESGNLIEIGGYGRYGPAGNQQGTGTFHRAQNEVSSVAGWDLITWFTKPTKSAALPREGIGAPGDSGGTVLMDDGSGQWYLAGVHRAGSHTNPENNYGKQGWETRIKSFQWWIDQYFDPLWRSEIEADPGDLNIDGVVDVQDIYAMRAAHGTTVPVTLKKFDFFNNNRIDATPGSAESDLDPYITQGIGTRYGDTNLDRNVDRTDYDRLVNEFNGQQGSGKDWSSGDTDFDSDVDGNDYFTLVANYEFATSPEALKTSAISTASTPRLQYDPLTGEVILASSDLVLDAYQIRVHEEIALDESLFTFAFESGIQDLATAEVFQLDTARSSAPVPPGGELFSLGSIFPLGLDLLGLESILDVARYTAGPDVMGHFAVVVSSVPEPATVMVWIVGAIGMLVLRRQ